MYHPKMVEFDSRLKSLLDEVDHYIEDRYAGMYSLNPVRPTRGETPNPEADGLFGISADFTPGFTSELGRGYLINVRMSTLDKVEQHLREEIYEAAVEKVKELLPLRFPERELTVRRDKKHFKIQGDFSLGDV